MRSICLHGCVLLIALLELPSLSHKNDSNDVEEADDKNSVINQVQFQIAMQQR